jgi:glycine/D-amino acid oxidase-like deaminating enzyme
MGPAMRASQGKRMKTDVLIVGGGLAGSATAYYLAREGVAVTLIERGSLNGRASGANAGSIHVQIPYPEYVELGPGWARGFAPVLPMMRDSVAMWAGLGKELGTDLEVALTGGLLVAETEAQLRIVAEKAALERAHGIETRMLGRDELRALAPYVSPRMIGAAFCAGEGKANPLKAGPAFAAAARRLGATILPDTPLLALAKDRAGYCGQTSAGPIHARRVVNAAGAEAAAIGRMLGLELAIDGFPLQVSVTEPVAPLVGHLLYSAAGKLTLKQMANGTCLIGGGWPSRRRGDGSLALNPASFAANLATATATVPALAGARIARSWPAIVNGTADWRPLLGEAPGRPGVFLQLFPWMGFTAGPIAARVIADLVLGRKPPVDLTRISALA